MSRFAPVRGFAALAALVVANLLIAACGEDNRTNDNAGTPTSSPTAAPCPTDDEFNTAATATVGFDYRVEGIVCAEGWAAGGVASTTGDMPHAIMRWESGQWKVLYYGPTHAFDKTTCGDLPALPPAISKFTGCG